VLINGIVISAKSKEISIKPSNFIDFQESSLSNLKDSKVKEAIQKLAVSLT